MKRYRYIFLFAFVAMLCMGLSSCMTKNEPRSEEAELVGTWRLSGAWGGFSQALGTAFYLQFRANGIGYRVVIGGRLLGPEHNKPEIEVDSFTYTFSGREMIGKAIGENEGRFKVSVTNNKLIIEETSVGSGFPLEFVRVSDSEVETYLRGK